MTTEIKPDNSKFLKWTQRMLGIDKQLDGALQTIVYPFLFEGDQSVQARRWMSQGASEGYPWKPLNKSYAKYKLKRYASYPGGGSKLLVAKSRLLGANTGRPTQGGDINKLIQNGTLYVRVAVPYAGYVNSDREIKRFSPETYRAVTDKVKQYMKQKVSIHE
jgi:hypothetical protein